ncbi:MAG: RNA-binding S4 domain-containing protein [Bacilli bacterium]|nr:RNA-binding S4 domain-containing protein [Bacilli bacterium]
MRLDLVLKHSGLIKRRVVSKAYCERGLVLINDKVGKPSSEVKSGDILQVTLGNRIVRFSIDIKQEGKKIILNYELIEDYKKTDA